MGRVIFDMGSTNTFRTLWFNEVEIKDIQFPPWLTLPIHYQAEKWRLVVKFELGNFSVTVLTLECGHKGHTSSLAVQNISFSKRVFVNCRDCGGNGKITVE